MVAGALAGETYFIRVGGWSGAAGTGTITVTESTRPQPAGSMSAWLDAVGSGLAPSFVDSGFIGPSEADIGPTNGAAGVTYEFVVHGDNAGPSTGLLGSRDGAAVGLKFEQWSNSEQYGVTNFGIADHRRLDVRQHDTLILHPFDDVVLFYLPAHADVVLGLVAHAASHGARADMRK